MYAVLFIMGHADLAVELLIFQLKSVIHFNDSDSAQPAGPDRGSLAMADHN
jgi:hypothetical protein